MAEHDKDLPLVVSEILIEMPGMNDRLKGVENRPNNVENLLVQVVGSIQHLSGSVKTLSETMLRQQQENNKRFELLIEADRANTTMLINAFRDEASAPANDLRASKIAWNA